MVPHLGTEALCWKIEGEVRALVWVSERERERERKAELKHSVQESRNRKEQKLSHTSWTEPREFFFIWQPQNKTISRAAKIPWRNILVLDLGMCLRYCFQGLQGIYQWSKHQLPKFYLNNFRWICKSPLPESKQLSQN